METTERYFENLRKDYINQIVKEQKKIDEVNLQKQRWYHDICVSFEFLKKYYINIHNDTYSIIILSPETTSNEFYAMFCWCRNDRSMDFSGLRKCDELYEVLSNSVSLYYRSDIKYNYYIKPNKFIETNDINVAIRYIFDTLYKSVLKYSLLFDDRILY